MMEAEQVDRAVVVRKKLAGVYNKLVTENLTNNQLEEVKTLLERALELSSLEKSMLILTYNNFACYYKKINKLAPSLKYLQKARQLDINAPSTHLNLCAVLSQQGRHKEAFNHAINAVVFLQAEYIDALQTQSNEFSDQIPVLAIAYHNMGVELEILKRMPEALRMYTKAHDFAKSNLPPDHPIIQNLNNVLNSAQKDNRRAKREKERKIPKARFSKSKSPEALNKSTTHTISKKLSPNTSVVNSLNL